MKENRIKIQTVILGIVLILLVVLDQISKILVRRYLNPANGGHSVDIIKGVFSLHYLENNGSAFGMFAGNKIFLLIVVTILTALLVYVYVKLPKEKKYDIIRYILVFILAGAVGNYIDRVIFGYVTDFLYFELISFPIFNIADCYITVSAFLLLILAFTKFKDDDLEFLSLKKTKGEKN